MSLFRFHSRRLPGDARKQRASWYVWVGLLALLIGGVTQARADGTLTPAPALPTPTSTPAPVPIRLSVGGAVSSGTAGLSVNARLSISLHLLRPDPLSSDIPKDVAVFQAILDNDKHFQFDNIVAQSGDLMFVSALYEGVQQSSGLIELTADQPNINLPLILYGSTNDPGVVTLIRARQVLDFRGADAVQVIVRNFYRNSGDRFYLSAQKTATDRLFSITVPLPIGASGIAFDETQRFEVAGTAMARVIQDTRAVRPGEVHEVIASYQVPYQRGATIDQDYPYVTERVEILIPEDASVKLTSAEVVGSGSGVTPYPLKVNETVNTTLNPQRRYLEYLFEFASPLKAGDRFVYTIEGSTPRTPTATPTAGDPLLRSRSPLNPFLIFFVLLIAFGGLVAGVVILRRILRAGR